MQRVTSATTCCQGLLAVAQVWSPARQRRHRKELARQLRLAMCGWPAYPGTCLLCVPQDHPHIASTHTHTLFHLHIIRLHGGDWWWNIALSLFYMFKNTLSLNPNKPQLPWWDWLSQITVPWRHVLWNSEEREIVFYRAGMHGSSCRGVVQGHDAGGVEGKGSRYDVRRWCCFVYGCFGSFAHRLFVRCSCRCRRLEFYNPFRTACRFQRPIYFIPCFIFTFDSMAYCIECLVFKMPYH